MRVEILNDYQEISDAAASAMIRQVKQKPDSVICLASGDTPKLAFQKTVERARKDKISFSEVHFIGLDEWVGIPPDITGNCALFLRQVIFSPLGIPEEHIHLFDSMANDLEEECQKIDEVILKKGAIDLVIVGIGMNGHIGFNEPGVSPQMKSHVTILEEKTRSVGQKYFKEDTVLNKGITLGLQHILDAKKVILLANGKHKAEIIKKTLKKGISPEIPATILRTHPHCLILLDNAAASYLNPND
jgi:glucosamine-6-phosphate isomerase